MDGRAGRRTGAGFAHGAGDRDGSGRLEQLALVRDMPLDGAVPVLQPAGESAERQLVFAVGVQQADRRVDDPLAGVITRDCG